jgi:hypothetical protein
MDVPTLQRPLLHLVVSAPQRPELHRGLSGQKVPMLTLEVSTPQWPKLHLDVSAQKLK